MRGILMTVNFCDSIIDKNRKKRKLDLNRKNKIK